MIREGEDGEFLLLQCLAQELKARGRVLGLDTTVLAENSSTDDADWQCR